MLLLHIAWLPSSGTSPGRLALWGECNRIKVAASRSRKNAHPFGATHRVLKDALPLSELQARAHESTLVARLPTVGKSPQPSRAFMRKSTPAGKIRLKPWSIPDLLFPPRDALALLVHLPSLYEETPGLELAADARFWQTAARFALELLAGQRFQPALVEENARCFARWRPILNTADDRARLEKLVRAMPPSARAVARCEKDTLEESGPDTLLNDFLDAVTDDFARDHVVIKPHRKKARLAPAGLWLAALCKENAEVDLPEDFMEQYRAWSQPVAGDEGNFRLCFRLDPPSRPDTDEVPPNSRAERWMLRYFLQANDDASLLVPASAAWCERGGTLKFLNRKFDHPQEKLLAGLGLASRLFPPLEGSLRQARPESCALSAQGAYDFIREAALLLQSSGFGVLLPNLGAKLGVRVKLHPAQPRKTPKGVMAGLTLGRVVAFDWELALGDQPLSREEFEKLADLKVPLVQIRGQWVELHPDQLQKALNFLQQRGAASLTGELSLADALRMALAPEKAAGLTVTRVDTEGWFSDLLDQMAGQTKLKPLIPPPDFVGTLRHYQITGFSWLVFLRQFGLGACLADDMGLGKTPQTIAYLLQRRTHNGRKPALVVCPTSVVSNWQHELARFAPGLRVHIHHGAGREKENFARQAARHDIVITSYALLHRDEKHLKEVAWGEVILDEAQNIKNPDTKQAKAACGLPAEHRLALTGTPIENRLAEVWSIFRFLNPGYLGSEDAFRSAFARPIERMQDPDATQRLKALVAPFILRRLKTDPGVITDLPAKNEMKVFCNLTREQATLYEAVVKDSLRQIEEAEGVQRRGIILAVLMKLKQVCNHPAQFLGDGSELAGRSGKLNRLAEMLEEVRAVKERVLIFTQFAEMGKLLKAHLEAALGEEALFLYGSTPAKARTAMIDHFQTDPHGPLVFILSIKAGGTGLNLTRANHVFHFDRWWNPAVENQATDRAFRIGQTRNVQVFKFVSAGTVEERIDEMIERKQALAASIVGTSEAWITEMTTNQLRELFTLRKDAVA
jgi:SNF2 family DNA or RNA helicase